MASKQMPNALMAKPSQATTPSVPGVGSVATT